MWYGVVPTKIFLHENFSEESFVKRKFLDLRYSVKIKILMLYSHTLQLAVVYVNMKVVLIK